MNPFESLSHALTPHREALQSTIGQYLCEIRDELRRGNEREEKGRPSMYDKWSSRPFSATGSSVLIIQSQLSEALLLQTLWFQVKHKKAGEPLPAFLLVINGIPTFALAPSRVLEPEEWAVYSQVFGGDMVIPRGSTLEIVPIFTGEFEIKGAITFTRETVPITAEATGGISQEQYNAQTVRQHEPGRFMPGLPPVHSDWTGPGVPGADTIAEEWGGDISPDRLIAVEEAGEAE